MKAIDPKGMSKGVTGTVDGRMETGTTRPPNMPKKGDSPKSSMFDGPYGGKKPQS
ncbi:MAG: hypothetical protein ACXWCO_00760 [Caldimonas sp.]